MQGARSLPTACCNYGRRAGLSLLRLGVQLTVERTISWLSNDDQLRPHSGCQSANRLVPIALGTASVITAKLIS